MSALTNRQKKQVFSPSMGTGTALADGRVVVPVMWITKQDDGGAPHSIIRTRSMYSRTVARLLSNASLSPSVK